MNGCRPIAAAAAAAPRQQQQRGGGGVAAELDRGAEHGMKAQSVETLEGGQEAEEAARATCHMSVVITSCMRCGAG